MGPDSQLPWLQGLRPRAQGETSSLALAGASVVRFSFEHDPMLDLYRAVVEIEGGEYMTMARLDGFDRRLLEECEDSDSVADKLLALELIARRIEEGKK